MREWSLTTYIDAAGGADMSGTLKLIILILIPIIVMVVSINYVNSISSDVDGQSFTVIDEIYHPVVLNSYGSRLKVIEEDLKTPPPWNEAAFITISDFVEAVNAGDLEKARGFCTEEVIANDLDSIQDAIDELTSYCFLSGWYTDVPLTFVNRKRISMNLYPEHNLARITVYTDSVCYYHFDVESFDGVFLIRSFGFVGVN